MARNNYTKDLHAVLGVDENAGPEELRRAYLALVVKYHPDRNPGDSSAEDRFKDISQAYAILSDPAARARYERLRPKRSPRPKTASSSSSSAAGSGTSSARSASAGRPGGGPQGAAKPQGQPGSAGDSAAGGREEASSGRSGSGPETENERPGADFDEIMAEFFKSSKGQDTLRDLEGALKNAGLRIKAEDFTRWVNDRRQGDENSAKSWWERLSSWLPGSAARARKKAESHDIQYQLSLSPPMAAAGTTVEISYWRDDSHHHLKVRIPAGTKDGTRLRLSGQGRLKPDGSRGDLRLTVLVGQTQTVADLWKT